MASATRVKLWFALWKLRPTTTDSFLANRLTGLGIRDDSGSLPTSMAITIRWSTTIPGHSNHLLAIDPAGDRLYAGDGWGIAYAALSLRILDMSDGRELARLRTKHQQPRSIGYRSSDVLLATDSRLFQLSRTDLSVRRVWERGVTNFADALALDGDKLLMTNWLRPTAGILDLNTGRTTRWLLDAGLRPLRLLGALLLYSLRTGLLCRVDIGKRSAEVIMRAGSARWVALAADRWLAVLEAPWARSRGSVEEPAKESTQLAIHDLKTGSARRLRLSRGTVAVEAGPDSPTLWLVQRATGPRVIPSIVQRVDADTGQTIDTINAPAGKDVVRVSAEKSAIFFAVPEYHENRAVIYCATVG